MVDIRNLTKKIYMFMSRNCRRHFTFLVVLAVGLGAVIWYYLNIYPYKWLEIIIYILAVALLYLVVSGIAIWIWFFGTFRYPSYWISKALALIRLTLYSKYLKVIMAFSLATIIWGFKENHFGDEFIIISFEDFFKEFLKIPTLIFILLLTLLLLLSCKMFMYRRRIVISGFENYTGDKELDKMISGISARLLNELNRLSILFNTIDEIQPNKESKIMEGALDVENLRKELGEIISPSSTIEIGKVKIPIKLIYILFRKAFHGPLLIGNINIKDNKLIMSACLKGGENTGSWQIDVEDIKEPYHSNSHLLILMTNQLTYRIFACIFRDRSPRWETMEHYARGLKFFRETVRTEENSIVNLLKAKNEFSLAIRKDNLFVQCLYNIGIIYMKLKNQHAAVAAFREAIALKPDYCHCYYQLASISYKTREYDNALWFCQQAINICPTNSVYWNLLGVINYYQWKEKDRAENGMNNLKRNFFERKDIQSHLILPVRIGAFLAWRSLCKSIAVGEKIEKEKETAKMNIRNLAVLYGKMHKSTAEWLFNQALMLSPDDNELHYEKGKYYFKKENWKHAYESFRRVYEDDRELCDPISFWAMYIHSNARLLEGICKTTNKKSDGKLNDPKSESCLQCKFHDKEKCNKYKRVILNGYRLFLAAVARIIVKQPEKNGEKEQWEKELLLNLNFVKEAFKSVRIEHGGYNMELLLNLLNISLPDNNGNYIHNRNQQSESSDFNFQQSSISRDEGERQNQILTDHDFDHTEKVPDFMEWAKAQQTIIDTKKILKILSDTKDKNAFSALREIEEPLHIAVTFFEKKGLSELRILGLHRYLAEVRFRLQRYSEALSTARTAIRYNPYDRDSRRLLGEIYLEMKEYQNGIEELEISFNLGNPSHEILTKIGGAYNKMAALHFESERRHQLLQKAIEIYNLCLTLMKDKSYEECPEEELEPEEKKTDRCSYLRTLMDIHYCLGTTYFSLMEYSNASTHFKIALELAKNLGHKKDSLRIWYKLKQSHSKAKTLQKVHPLCRGTDHGPGESGWTVRKNVKTLK